MRASTTPANPSQTSNFAPMVQGQGVTYMMPVPQHGGKPHFIRPVPGIKCLSIALIVLGSVLAVLGIVAIILDCYYSYLGNPIWTGLLFLLTTGILGLFVYTKQNNLCMNIAYLVMTLVSAVAAFQLFVFELRSAYYGYWWLPTMLDVATVLCALASLVLCIISCVMTLYGTFTCCYNCCNSCCNDTSATVRYSPLANVNGQNVPLMATAHIASQGSPYTQQTTSQPLVFAAHQPFIQNAPPEYIPVNVDTSTQPQTIIVPDKQYTTETANAPSGNPLSSSGNINGAESKPLAPDQTSTPDKIDDTLPNWQKF